MKTITVSFDNTSHSVTNLCESLTEILSNNNTLSLATSDGDKAYINTAHYGYSEALDLFIITDSDTKHSQNALNNPSVAVAIWNRPAVWGTDLKGLQLFGAYEEVTAEGLEEAMDAYGSNIPAFTESFKTIEDVTKAELTFYKIHVEGLKLLDEPRFGRRNYIEVSVIR